MEIYKKWTKFAKYVHKNENRKHMALKTQYGLQLDCTITRQTDVTTLNETFYRHREHEIEKKRKRKK